MRSVFPSLACLFVAGCGGGVPLMHPVHAVAPDEVTFGAGFSGVAVAAASSHQGAAADARVLEASSVDPGLAPWVGARVGFGSGVDAGLIYTGRTARLDARRVWALSDSVDLSAGFGVTGLVPRRDADLRLRIGGFGGDLPLLVGWRSPGEIYSLWIGARGGGEWLGGQQERVTDPAMPDRLVSDDVRGWHAWTGGLVGLRVGFHRLFAVLEVDASAHWAVADIAERRVTSMGFALTPAGALVSRF